MAKLTTIVKSVERAGEAAGALKRPLRSQPQQGDLTILESAGEYERVAGELDKANQVPATPKDVREEIARAEAEDFELRRQERISNPRAETSTFFKHSTPEEYRARLDNQLRDPDYAVRSIQRATIGMEDFAKEQQATFRASVLKSQEADVEFQTLLKSRAMKNPRYKAGVERYTADGAYGDQVMIHIDRQVDPIRGGTDDFVQFENAPEFGIHSGTNLAAEGSTIRTPDFELRRMERINADIEIAADALEIPVKEFHEIVAQSLNAHFLTRFKAGEKRILTGQFEELEELLGEAMLELGIPAEMAGKLISDIKGASTASATPHYFRGENGLYLDDTGAFRSRDVAEQLRTIFPEDAQTIDVAAAGTNKEATKKLQQFIEDKGYDHIVYHNAVEDKGQLSVINWNPDLMKTIWDEDLTRGNDVVAAQGATSYVMALLGIGVSGAAVRDEK